MITDTSTIHCQACDYTGQVLFAHKGYKWWMLPLGFLLACTGIGIIPLALILIPLGNRTYKVCPSCKGESIEEWSGIPPMENVEIWTKAREADDKAFSRNKLILLGFVMTLFAAVILFVILNSNYYL